MRSLLLLTFTVMAAVRLQAVELLPKDSPVRISITGMLDLETYFADQPAPGLLFSNDDVFFNPRLALFADLHFGGHLAGFVHARFDRGFDPGSLEDGDLRLDEYSLTWTPLDKPVFN